MNYEKQLIGAIINSGRFISIELKGINGAYFVEPLYREIFNFLCKFHRNFNKVPDVQTVTEYFPVYSHESPVEPVEFYTEWLMKNHMQNLMKSYLGKCIDFIDQGKNPEDTLKIMSEGVQQTALVHSGGYGIDYRQTSERKAVYEHRRDSKGITGLCTGLQPIDSASLGFQPADMVVIAGRPGIGKTFMLLRFVKEFWHRGYTVLLVTMEMSAQALAIRADSIFMGFNYNLLRRGLLGISESEYFNRLTQYEQQDNALHIEGGLNTVAQVEAKARQVRADVVCIDGAYLLSPNTSRKSARWEQCTEVSRDIKAMGRRMKLPNVITWQMNRGTRKKDMSVKNLAYTDAVGQDADVVLGLWQDSDMKHRHEFGLYALKMREDAQFSFTYTENRATGFFKIHDQNIKTEEDDILDDDEDETTDFGPQDLF